ncbi:MAG: hypothetical protein II592_01910 [Muribaculaceae bacterium]|nr:hypothetical protein [Muribaculaceae bacterium]
MKKIIISLLMLMGVTGVQAQEPEFVPLVREGVKRVYVFNHHGVETDGGPIVYYTEEMKGETTLNGRQYMNLYRYYGDELDVNTMLPYAYVREQDKKVYAVLDENNKLEDGDFNVYRNGDPVIKTEDFESTGEYLIYDFNDFVAFYDTYSYKQVQSTGEIEVNGHMCKAYYLDENQRYLILEGVGSVTDRGLLFPMTGRWVNGPHPHTLGLSHVIEGGEVVYKSPRYDELKDKLTPTAVVDLKTTETRSGDNRYYNLMGQPVAKPTQPGIYIHQGNKIVIK